MGSVLLSELYTAEFCKNWLLYTFSISNFIDKIEGSYYNILGVPVEVIYKHINNMGYNLKDLEKIN